MGTAYESVVDPYDLVWTLTAYGLHGLISVLHLGLVCFLAGSGAYMLWRGPRALGGVRVVLAILLLAPLGLGAPMLVSMGAAVGTVALLWLSAQPRRRFIRRAAIACAVIVASFMAWEGEDNLTLGTELVIRSSVWRAEELDWQHEMDPSSPKVGDLAPDFALQDPDGKVQVRLSDYRGKRPVALVFGSYT